MLRLITAFTICLLCIFTTTRANKSEILSNIDVAEVLFTAEKVTATFATITILGRLKTKRDGQICCIGRKGVCMKAELGGGLMDHVYVITTYNENGAPNDFFLVSSFEIVEGEENGEPVTYFYYELYEE